MVYSHLNEVSGPGSDSEGWLVTLDWHGNDGGWELKVVSFRSCTLEFQSSSSSPTYESCLFATAFPGF